MAKNMKVCASSVMANAINKSTSDFKVTQVRLTSEGYDYFIGFRFFDDKEMDYLTSSGLYRALRIDYPDYCYAMPVFVSTSDMLEILHKEKCDTLDDFTTAFYDRYAI